MSSKKLEYSKISERPFLMEWIAYRGTPAYNEYMFVNKRGRYKEKPITGATAREAFNYYCELAGIPSTRTIHGMRHNRITNWVQAGYSLSEAAKMAGHSSTKVTEGTYTHLAMQKLINKFKDLDEEGG